MRTSGCVAAIQSSPDRICEVPEKRLSRSSTLTATTFTPGATPRGAMVPFEAMIPATLVPCPLSSWADRHRHARPGVSEVIDRIGADQGPALDQAGSSGEVEIDRRNVGIARELGDRLGIE